MIDRNLEDNRITAQIVIDSIDEQYNNAEQLYFKWEHEVEKLHDNIDFLLLFKKNNQLPHKNIIDYEHKKRLIPLTINLPLSIDSFIDFKDNIRKYQKKYQHDAINQHLDLVFNKIDQLHIMFEQLEEQLDLVIQKNRKLLS